MIFIEKSMEDHEAHIIVNDDNNIDDSYFLEATNESTYIMRGKIYQIVESTLNNPTKDKAFKKLISDFIDKNGDKLRTPGPMYMIAFTDADKVAFFKLFGITDELIVKTVKELTSKINGSDFLYLRQNPIFWLFVNCIRYYTITKDNKGLNATLAIYALSVYPAIFRRYFHYGVSSPGCMIYTIDQLTNKFIIKQQGYIFGALNYSIQQSYKFLQDGIRDGSDLELIRWIQRIRNDQNSMIKKIANQYMINHDKGLSVMTALDSGESGEIIDSYVNDTSQVESTVQAILLPMITNGVILKYAEAAAKMCVVSISEIRNCLIMILVDKETERIKKFIESIVFLWLYTEKKPKNEINTSQFLIWSAALFKKTNSNDLNIKNIKDSLNYWGEYCGIHKRFTREPTRVCYKRAIFFYFVLSIQYYNH